jgi:predicted ATPase
MKATGEPQHLREVRFRRAGTPGAGFPFDTAVVRALDRIEFSRPVTMFVGENGSGKSTLLEAIAIAAALPAIGMDDTGSDPTLSAQRELAARLKLTWSRRTHRGFFLRAEDFFGFARRMSRTRAEMLERLDDVERELAGASEYARRLASGPARASLADMQQLYGENLDARSHGESFLTLFRSRFLPGGLYLLDEPEAPLSPRSQLALLAMLGDMVEEGAQFIIATHSPLLLAFPGALIYSFDRIPPGPVEYEQLEHVTLTRDFLNRPGQFLRHLTPGGS